MLKKLTCLLYALVLCLPVSAQEQEPQDSLVWLMSAKSVKTVDVEGRRYRQVIGPARFFHNNTYMLCDTALWNMETKVIDAWGNVSILQEETVLTSDNLKYLVDQDLAQFRGSVVQLTDKDHNTLRTRHLDYNTKDSLAIFMNGGAMRDKDGQIIESRNGTYDSKIKTFTFSNDVNMFTDSIFVKTRSLVYESDLNLATFGSGTNAWQEDNMLSSENGWYDSGKELFLFRDKVHVMSPDQEGWCDSLYFRRMSSDVEMLGNAQISDTTRNVFALAGRIEYIDTLSKVTLTRKPAVITQTEEEEGGVDTVYLGAEKLVYYTVRKFEIPESIVKDAEGRLVSLDVDPVGTFRKKAAEAAAKAAEEEAMKDPNYRPKGQQSGPSGPGAAQTGPGAKQTGPAKPQTGQTGPGAKQAGPRRSAAPPLRAMRDSLAFSDTTSLEPEADSLSRDLKESLLPQADTTATGDSLALNDSLAIADSLAALPKDSTRIGFLEAIRNVRIYKKDMQVVCDSLLYCDLDSLARMFIEPIIWQDVAKQYRADSISVVVSGGNIEKASLMSNAFISIREDSLLFDQIKGAEMLAFFGPKGSLERFDVLGGASALFYIEENETLATVNKTDSKMLSAILKNGEIQRIYYFDAPKNDGYPVVQLPEEEQRLKGFSWEPERRPADRNAVTPLSLRPSERASYSARPKATFRQTDIYFPGYMNDIYRQIEVRDSLRAVRERDRQIAEARAAERARLDSLAAEDSLSAAVDSLALADSLSLADSLAAGLDSLAAATDSLALADSLATADSRAAKVLTPEEIKAAEKAAAKAEKERKKAEARAAKEAKRKAKQEAREARWAELDARDAAKLKEKEEKRLEKERQRKIKALEDQKRQREKDEAAFEKYKRRYEKQKARRDAKAAKRALKKQS